MFENIVISKYAIKDEIAIIAIGKITFLTNIEFITFMIDYKKDLL